MHGALRVGQDFAGLRQWGGCAERKEQPPLTNPDQLSACSLGPLPLPCTALSSSHISHISYIQRGLIARYFLKLLNKIPLPECIQSLLKDILVASKSEQLRKKLL